MSHASADKPSKAFMWWFLAIQLAPLIRQLWDPGNMMPMLWMVIFMINTTVFTFNLSSYLGHTAPEPRTMRFLMLAATAIFALFALIYIVQLALLIYATGELKF
jgi:hypothetical protein